MLHFQVDFTYLLKDTYVEFKFNCEGKLMKFNIIVITILAALLPKYALADAEDQVESQEVQSNQCGIVAVYKNPPSTKNVHFASINSIDGQIITSGGAVFALSPGKHIVKVIENIRENSLTRRRGEAKNFKFIEVNIEANKKYNIGAKYIRKNRSKLSTGEYWQPVVWSTSDENCKLGA